MFKIILQLPRDRKVWPLTDSSTRKKKVFFALFFVSGNCWMLDFIVIWMPAVCCACPLTNVGMRIWPVEQTKTINLYWHSQTKCLGNNKQSSSRFCQHQINGGPVQQGRRVTEFTWSSMLEHLGRVQFWWERAVRRITETMFQIVCMKTETEESRCWQSGDIRNQKLKQKASFNSLARTNRASTLVDSPLPIALTTPTVASL